jgi:lysophospholipase L1-like esterase
MISASPPRRRTIGAGLLASLVSVAAIALGEIALRLVPSPPERFSPDVFLDRQGGLEEIERGVLEELKGEDPEALRANRIYREDDATFWRLRSGTTLTGKNYLIPRAARDRLPFTVTLNADGFRGPSMPRARRDGAIRVIAAGNSSTFGWGVSDEETYPAQLARRLEAHFPGRPIEVMNAGVPGFTSYQGLRILSRDLLPRRPDFVVLAFGFNDSRRAATSDSAFARARARPVARAARAVRRLAIARRLERALAAVRGARAADRLSPGPDERTTVRVPVAEFAATMREMILGARAAGARPSVLAMVIPQEYRDALVAAAREASVPFLDTRPYLVARIADDDVRAAFAETIARHEAAWDGVAAGAWKNPAYADATHPSAVGHALIADWVARVIANAARLDGAPPEPRD